MTRKFAASLDSGFLFETAYQGQSVSMSLARRSSRAKDTDWTQVLFKIFNIRTGTADILTG